jgi:hypothetical protein
MKSTKLNWSLEIKNDLRFLSRSGMLEIKNDLRFLSRSGMLEIKKPAGGFLWQ